MREPQGPWQWEIFDPYSGWTHAWLPSWMPSKVVLLTCMILEKLTDTRFYDYEKVTLVEDE